MVVLLAVTPRIRLSAFASRMVGQRFAVMEEIVHPDAVFKGATGKEAQLMKEFLGLFPLVEYGWLRSKVLMKRWDMCKLLEEKIERPDDVPERQKKKEVAEHKMNKEDEFEYQEPPFDYIKDMTELPNWSYRNAVEFHITKAFPRISLMTLREILNFYRYHYAPAYISLNVATRRINYNQIAGMRKPYVWVWLRRSKCEEPRQFRLKILFSRRWIPARPRLYTPPSLEDELQWIEDERERLRRVHKRELEEEKRREEKRKEEAKQVLERERQKQEHLEEARARGEAVECLICMEECSPCDLVVCADGHEWCCDCLTNAVYQSVFGGGRTKIACFKEDCQALFPRSVLEMRIPEEWLKSLDARQQEEALLEADLKQILERCKFCDTPAIMDVPVDVDKVFRCPNPDCKALTCRVCKNKWDYDHLGKPCDEMIRDFKEMARKQIEEKMVAAVVRLCPSCGVENMKDGGCNKIVCRCGCFYCYLCQKELPRKDPYDHFCKCPRKPGAKCHICQKECALFEDPEIEEKRRLKELAKQQREIFGTVLTKAPEKEKKIRFHCTRPIVPARFGRQPPPPPKEEEEEFEEEEG